MKVCKFSCYIRREQTIDREDYTCMEVRQKKEAWLAEWRKVNHSEFVEKTCGQDLAFEEFRNSIEDALKDCKCDENKNISSTCPN